MSTQITLSENTAAVIMGRMRQSSLSLHGIEGAFSDVGCKTVIPSKIGGKFSIRCVTADVTRLRSFSHLSGPYSLVPPQTPENVIPLVEAYLESEFAKLNSKNKMTIEYLHGGRPWVTDPKHWNFEAARRATEVRYF